MRTGRTGTTKLLMVALVAVLAVSACTFNRPPEGPPSIHGTVTTLTAGDGAVTMFVTATEKSQFDKASVTMDKKTKVLIQEGNGYKAGSISDVRPNSEVDVWLTGPVAESYPVQATAGTVVVFPR